MYDNLQWLLPIYGLLLVFYIPLIVFLRKSRKTTVARRRFCRGITAVLSNCTDSDECLSQVQMLYKRLAERHTSLDERFRSPVEMLEDLIVSMDTYDARSFERALGIGPPLDLRQQLVEMLKLMKAEQPFSSLSPKQGNLLKTVRHAIETANQGLATTALSQLGDEIEVLESTLRRQEQKTQIAFIFSVVGVILTLFFGLVSFVQFMSA